MKGVKRGRREASLSPGEEKMIRKIRKFHGHMWRRAYEMMKKKPSALRSTLKRRSLKSNVHFNVRLGVLKTLLFSAYGKQCKYCKEALVYRNMVCDHKVSMTSGGESVAENLEIICRRCNTRKGPLSTGQYIKLLQFLRRQNGLVHEYVLRKLAKGDF